MQRARESGDRERKSETRDRASEGEAEVRVGWGGVGWEGGMEGGKE